MPQDHLERVLQGHLRSLRPARVWLATELLRVDQDAAGVTAVLRDLATGASRTVRAHYLVGADGVHSAVRTRCGIAMRGPDSLGHFLSALFRAPLWEVLGERRYGIYPVSQPGAPGVFVPAGPGGRWVYGLELDPAQDRPGDYSEERLVQRIRAAAGMSDLALRIERVGTFRFAARIAARYRGGSIFLVGDAAHQVSPRGGTGLNTAIQDGHNLGWKLAWVLRGWAGPGLLDSYSDERRPVGLHNTLRSAQPDGSRCPVSEALPVDLGGRIPHVWLRVAGRRVSSLDLLDTGWTVFRGPRAASPPSLPDRGREVPVATHRVAETDAAALGVPADGALVVRPDGVPATRLTAAAGGLRLAG